MTDIVASDDQLTQAFVDAQRQAFDRAVIGFKQRHGHYPVFTWFTRPGSPQELQEGTLRVHVMCSDEEPPPGTQVWVTGVLNEREVSE